MASGLIVRVLWAIRDAVRLTKAFDLASRSDNEAALRVLDSLAKDTNDHYSARLLRGALSSLLDEHEVAMKELVLAAQAVKATKSLSKMEMNYLVVYAVQYWEYSADQLGIHQVTKEVADALSVEGPIIRSQIRSSLKQRFPLWARFIRDDLFQ